MSIEGRAELQPVRVPGEQAKFAIVNEVPVRL